MINNFIFTCNFRLKLQNIIQKLSEHCDIKNPEELETIIVSILVYILEAFDSMIYYISSLSYCFVWLSE